MTAIWEVEFGSDGMFKGVETLPVPEDWVRDWGQVNIQHRVEFLPAPLRLALVFRSEVMVWDAQDSKFLLLYTDTTFYPKMSFSSDGLFAFSTAGSDACPWMESPTGYRLLQILASTAVHSSPLLSQNGESIYSVVPRTGYGTQKFIHPLSSVSARIPQRTENSVLEFSPDGMLAVAAGQEGNTVMVFSLDSSVPKLKYLCPSSKVWSQIFQHTQPKTHTGFFEMGV